MPILGLFGGDAECASVSRWTVTIPIGRARSATPGCIAGLKRVHLPLSGEMAGKNTAKVTRNSVRDN